MAIHTDIGPTRARLRTMVRGPIASFDSLGDQLAFHLSPTMYRTRVFSSAPVASRWSIMRPT